MIIGGSCAFFLPDDSTGHAIRDRADEKEYDSARGTLIREENTYPGVFQTNPLSDFHQSTSVDSKQGDLDRNQKYAIVALDDQAAKI